MPSPRAARVRRHGGRAAAKPPLSVEALWAIKRIAPPTLSPDGALACAAVTSFDMETNEETTELWLFPTGLAGKSALKSRRLTAGDKDSDPKWSPDGRWIAFTAKRKDDNEAQIYLIAPDGGEARRLTKVANGAAAIKWFADGGRIAFVSSVPEPVVRMRLRRLARSTVAMSRRFIIPGSGARSTVTASSRPSGATSKSKLVGSQGGSARPVPASTSWQRPVATSHTRT